MAIWTDGEMSVGSEVFPTNDEGDCGGAVGKREREGERAVRQRVSCASRRKECLTRGVCSYWNDEG